MWGRICGFLNIHLLCKRSNLLKIFCEDKLLGIVDPMSEGHLKRFKVVTVALGCVFTGFRPSCGAYL